MAKLGDVFPLVRNGASIRQTDGASGIPITRIETISNREIDRNKFGYADITDSSKYKDYILQDGDILMSHINSEKHLGKVALYRKQGNEQIIHGMNLLMLRANPLDVFPPYATHFFETPTFLMQIQKITKKSVNQASFTVTALKEIEIPLPPLDEQRRIAALLDKVSCLIAKRREQLDKLDELVKARFVEMFGDPVSNPYNWEKVPLSELADIRIGPFGSLLHKEDYIEGGHPLVNPSHIIDGKIVIDEKLTVSHQKYIELEAYHLKAGDVVMGRRGEMGRCAVVSQEGLLCGTGSLLIRPKGKVTADYIQKIISFPSFKKMIEDMAVGQTMPNLNVPIVSAFQIIKPPMQVQENYYTFVTQVDKSKLTIQQSLDKLEVMKKALMQEYFG